MARPVGLLRAMPADGEAILSWSTVASPALVVGRAHGRPAVDVAAARSAGVAVVRRTSGGGPVLWDEGMLAFDLVLPPGHPMALPDVVETYRPLGEAVASALVALGLTGVEVVDISRARAAARTPGGAAQACFGGLSPFEVLVDGRKVLGLSQARRRQGALLQAGILLDLDAPMTARLMGRDDAFARELAGDAAGLREYAQWLGHDLVVEAVESALVARTGLELRPDVPMPSEAGAIVHAMEEMVFTR